MAEVIRRIIAAPFAILGGVLIILAFVIAGEEFDHD